MTTETKKDQVWDKGRRIRGKDPEHWRKDVTGKPIRRSAYGTQGKYGWEIDHKYPKSKGGSDDLQNLQPLHWEENRKKADYYRQPPR